MTQVAISSHYTFGDTDLAAMRLSLLAETYERETRRLLDECLPPHLSLAIDLGSGLGHTTALLASIRPIEKIVGYERSPRYIAKAQALYPNLTFAQQDVLKPPYVHRNADLVYSRFLLTHLDAPETAIAHWTSLLKPNGLLVLEETAHLASPLEEFQEYYALVAEMQTYYGQELYIGRKLDAFARRMKLNIKLSRQRSFAIPAQRMARLHAMNLTTWKQDPYMIHAHPSAKLDQLFVRLERISNSNETVAPVTSTIAQLVVES
jgi:SAM-dependent methyltransferase